MTLYIYIFTRGNNIVLDFKALNVSPVPEYNNNKHFNFQFV